MEGWKAYVLPGVAALAMLAYWLLVPGLDDVGAPTPADDRSPPPGPSVGRSAGDGTRAELGNTDELPDDYVHEQRAALEERMRRCRDPLPTSVEVTIAGSPQTGAVVESVRADGSALRACLEQHLLDTRLAAPPRAGRAALRW